MFVLMRGNTGTGKTLTANSAFPQALYVNCRITEPKISKMTGKVVILDEIDLLFH